jgi:sulfate/thiosulfate transport system ATP-binding protein
MSVEVRGVGKRFGAFTALDDVTLHVRTGELMALLGPSGSGKTTLLRVIGGLEAPDEGRVLLHAEDATRMRVQDRRVGFVFQHYALFRHMTVFENVAFGLRARRGASRPSREAIARRVGELLGLVQLDGLGGRYPHQLSGGQRQRVALARALAIEPRVLLLDEPFGALDAQVRQDLRRWLRRLLDEVGITGLLVTHDRDEALEVADRVAVMDRGRIEQVGTPDELYERPASAFVFRFLGGASRFSALGAAGAGLARPHEVALARAPAAGAVPATVVHVHRIGAVPRVTLRPDNDHELIVAELSREELAALAPRPGERLFARPIRLRTFPEASAARPRTPVP